MKVFMRQLVPKQWVQVFENSWNQEDLYIDDPCHHSLCWGDCYTERDLVKEEEDKEVRELDIKCEEEAKKTQNLVRRFGFWPYYPYKRWWRSEWAR